MLTTNDITPQFCQALMFPRYDALTHDERESVLGACIKYGAERLAEDDEAPEGMPDPRALVRGCIKLSLMHPGVPPHLSQLTYKEALALSALTGALYMLAIIEGRPAADLVNLQVASQKFAGLAVQLDVAAEQMPEAA